MVGLDEVDLWAGELESVLARVAGRFSRVDLRWRMRDYVRGLLAAVERKNGWQLAEYAGHRGPAGFQHLLNGASWDADAVRDDLSQYVAERLGTPDGVLIVDDTGFLKKGTVSAGVQRQYSGTAGRTENCQIGVFAAYASPKGRALVDRELYLPKSWTADADRCRAAKIPDSRGFATKGELARAMILRALASPLPIAWVTGDCAYGQEWRMRRTLEEAGVGYVLAVPKSQQLHAPFGRIDQAIADAPDQAWERRSCGDGAKGPRLYDWAADRLPVIDVFDGDRPTHQRWVLARRSLGRPDEIAYYLAYAPNGTSVADLVRVAGSRWAIEEAFQAAKNECGLDQYEVRRYPGWYRHITLAMLAHAFLAAVAAQTTERGAAETTPPAPSASPWQKSADSWTLCCPDPYPATDQSSMP
ncbi:IS701 family transposase [Streptomyces sp. RPA4-5]|uniref:IS701 family transposase n=1 Tax=Streptomyces TaxID=1883 RepID=UPI00143EB9C6|nr:MULTISPECIES: IS701 family transposase [Streptomyces]MCX4635214.1 IS701 family transposase [Streptomyces platensis]QIY60191.1 IS701 family transposase [Streptomyces sp. RPA4-5]WJY40635.1 IS701 family transposase [Streptomyces sp. P9-2B-2]